MEMTRRRTMLLLAGFALLFALRASVNIVPYRVAGDEAQICAVATRMVVDGGPLYGNAVTNYGPVSYTFVEAVFRVAGLYSVRAVRAAEVLWWVLTAFVLYASGRTLFGRAGALGTAAAFLLAASHPGFQEIRGEALVALPLAAAVGLCASGVGRRGAVRLALCGAAVAAAFLCKQQAGLALPALAAWPLLAWWGRRRDEKLWIAACGSALVVSGFVAAMAAVWGWYAARGAGDEFVYCIWRFNWVLIEAVGTSGGYSPSVGFFLRRAARYLAKEPLLPVALTGAVVGLAWRGPDESEEGAVPWRAGAAGLVVLLGAMWLAATPSIPAWITALNYVPYQSLVYVPMCFLVGVCVEAASRGLGRRSLLIAVGAVAVAYGVAPVVCQFAAIGRAAALYARSFGLWRMVAPVAAMAAAGWLLAGRRVAWIAAALWVGVLLCAPDAQGWRNHHLTVAVHMVALGILRHAVGQRSLALAALAGMVHAAGYPLDYAAHLGLALGAAVWVMVQEGVSRRERAALALVYLIPAALVSAAAPQVMSHGAWLPPQWWFGARQWHGEVFAWLMAWRGVGILAVCGAALVGSRGRRYMAGHALGLLLCGGVGTLVVCGAPASGQGWIASLGAAAVTAAAIGADLLMRCDDRPAQARASLLLMCACVVPAVPALLHGGWPATQSAARETALVRAVEPGARLYVWGGLAAMECYASAEAVPATPQIGTWMVEGGGLPVDGAHRLPDVATLSGLDRCLSKALPRYIIVTQGVTASLADLPRFGPLFRTRYREAAKTGAGTLFERQ